LISLLNHLFLLDLLALKLLLLLDLFQPRLDLDLIEPVKFFFLLLVTVLEVYLKLRFYHVFKAISTLCSHILQIGERNWLVLLGWLRENLLLHRLNLRMLRGLRWLRLRVLCRRKCCGSSLDISLILVKNIFDELLWRMGLVLNVLLFNWVRVPVSRLFILRSLGWLVYSFLLVPPN
jgi:hypothetical protein